MDILNFMGSNWIFFLGIGLILGGIFAELAHFIGKLTETRKCVAAIKIHTRASEDIGIADLVLSNMNIYPTTSFTLDASVFSNNAMNKIQVDLFIAMMAIKHISSQFPNIPMQVWLEEINTMSNNFEENSAKAYLELFKTNSRITKLMNEEELNAAKGLFEQALDEFEKKSKNN